MDLDHEWEYLPDDGYLDFHAVGEKKTFWGKPDSDSKTVFNMNYFLCPAPNSMKITEPPGLPSQVVTVPIHLVPTSKAPEDGEPVKDITKVPIEISVRRPVVILERPNVPNTGVMEADQDVASHFFFKMKENEFVDMKKESPMSSSRGFMPQIDTSTFQFEDKGESLESKTSPRTEAENMDYCCDSNKKVTWEESGGSLNIWKWSFTGIGAICSFGVAAATICILFFGSHQRNKQHQQSQKLQFRIHSDDKGMREVEVHKLKEAISGVRGVANPITFGGFSEGI